MQKNAICGSPARGSDCRITDSLPSMSFENEKHHRCSRGAIMLTMKLTFVLLTAAFLNVSATARSQERISFSGENVALEKVFSIIKMQTGYGITYQANVFEGTRPVSADVKELSLENFLNMILKGQPIKYTLASKTILLTRKTDKWPVPDWQIDKMSALYLPPPLSGRVVDEKGEPLEGVSVIIKGTSISTVTGSKGAFTLADVPSDATLVFSYVGMKTRELKVTQRDNLVVKMEVDVMALGEVVATGYGTSKKKDLTGSLGVVSVSDLQKAPVRSFDEALAGRVAGVTVSSSDGQPGASVSIVIRGNNSITQSNSPLYVVDGFPIEDPNNNVINPDDIASITILKDASATAIYGARGANGVVLVTTKRGKEGPPVLALNASYGFQKVPETPALMSPYEFVKLQLEVAPGDINSPSSGAFYYLQDGNTLEGYKDSAAVDWQSKMFRVAPMQDYSVSVTGGSAATKYAISGSLLNQDGVVINSGYKRYQGRVVLDQTISKKLKVGINANYTYLTQSGISPYASTTGSLSSNMMFSVWGFRPFGSELANEEFDDNINSANDYRFNPVINQRNLVRLSNNNNLAANAYAEYNITRDLKLKVTGGINNNIREGVVFNNLNTSFGSPKLTNNGINGSDIYYRTNSWVNENTLTYNKRFNANHTLNVLAGVTAQKATTSSSGIAAVNLPGQATNVSWLKSGTASGVTSTASLYTLNSFLGRVNYDFQSKYLVTASFRADGSSKFAPENHWSYFPSGAIAWRFSNENFMKGLKLLSDGKLRVSYGVTGNNRVGDFDYLSQYNTSITLQGYTFDNNNVAGTIPSSLGNANLRWETTSQVDIGLDIGLLNDRINLTVDAYRKKTTDLILNAAIPQSYGYKSIYKNIGSVQNQGLEFTVNTTNVSNQDFSWTSSFNIGFNGNKVLSLTENQESLTDLYAPYDNSSKTLPAFIAKIGKPLGLMYGPVWDGVYQYDDFDQDPSGAYNLKSTVPTNGNVRSSVKPGDIKYKDINGDGVVDIRDFTIIGRGVPVHTGGFGNNFTYKGFDLNVFFQWSYGNDILNINKLVFEGSARPGLNQFASYEDRWTPDNPGSTLPRVGGYGPVSNSFSSRIIEDGSYLRLKTVSLGYSLPKNRIDKWKINSLRVYVAAQNLHTWTKYSGMDPEVSIYSSVLTPGVDYSAYPRSSTIVFGVNASF